MPVMNTLLHDPELKVTVLYKSYDSNDVETASISLSGLYITSAYSKIKEIIGETVTQGSNPFYIFKSELLPTTISMKDKIVTAAGDVIRIRGITPLYGMVTLFEVDISG